MRLRRAHRGQIEANFTSGLSLAFLNQSEKLRFGISGILFFRMSGGLLGGAFRKKFFGRVTMLQGLYKVEYETPRRKSVGIIVANAGQLRGGNSTFAYIGSYRQTGNAISGVITTQRHTDDPSYRPVFGMDVVRIDFQGVEKDNFASVEGTAAEFPSLAFKALLTRISD